MQIIESYLTKNPYWKKNQNPTDSRYKNYQKNGPKGMMLHSVGCSQPSAQAFVNSWNDPGYTDACIHAFIDANTGDVYRTMPSNYRAPHAGGDATNTHIGVEMCEPDCIKYKPNSASFTVSNRVKAQQMVKRTYESAVEFFALECLEWGFDPMKPGVIISHNEGHDMGIASNHADPEHLWKGVGLDYTMDGFRRDVRDKMLELTTVAGFADVPVGVWYAEDLEWAKDAGITKGIASDAFGPMLECSRAQIVTMLWRLWGSAKVYADVPFTDVPSDAYYRDAVAWAYDMGIVKGISEDEFGPDNPCTRAEIVTMIHRMSAAIAPSAVGLPFEDVPVDEWYSGAVAWAYKNGITCGISKDTFAPGSPVHRCEMVVLVHRWYTKTIKTD